MARAITLLLGMAGVLLAQPASVDTHLLPANGGPWVFNAAANLYGVSSTATDTRATPGAAQTKLGGGICGFGLLKGPCSDAIIVKADPSGNQSYATLLGGSMDDGGAAIAADAAGSAYVVGTTQGAFPTTAHAAIAASTTSKTFAAKISADGSAFLYSTYLPDVMATPAAIAVDALGNAYIAGSTAANHLCIVKLSADGSTVLYTKLFGGSVSELVTAIAATGGNIVIAGSTKSPDFPASGGALQKRLLGAQNAFLTELDPSGTIVFSTFLGGSGSEQLGSMKIDTDGAIYLAGSTSSLDFPATPGTAEPAPLVPAWNNSPGGFVAKLAADGSSILYATYVWSFGVSLGLGSSGDVYIAGSAGVGFPVTASAPTPCVPGGNNFAGTSMLAHLDSKGALLDGTYLTPLIATSAIMAEADGSVLLVGETLTRIRFGGPGAAALSCMTLSALNSANLYGTYVSAGEFVTLADQGIGPEEAVVGQPSPVQVFFDKRPAQVLYAQSRQVNVQAPFDLTGRSTSITLQYGGLTYGPIIAQIRFAEPGLFRLEPNVSAQAYAVNADGILNGPGNPAARGTYVSFWGTGLGTVSPACEAGGLHAPGPVNLTPGLSVVLLGGGPVTYAGGAPTLPCGVIQVNMQVPTDWTPGAHGITPEVRLTQADGTGMFVDSSSPGSTLYVK